MTDTHYNDPSVLPTPRTDAFIEDHGRKPMGPVVFAGNCRDIERDLAWVTSERDRVSIEYADTIKHFGTLLAQMSMAAFGHCDALTDEQFIASLKNLSGDLARVTAERDAALATKSDLYLSVELAKVRRERDEARRILNDLVSNTSVGETKDFYYPRWVWEGAKRLTEGK